MNSNDFKKFKNKEIRAILLLAFIGCLCSLISKLRFAAEIAAFILLIIHLKFQYEYKSKFTEFGFPRFRKYFLRYLVIGIVLFLTLYLTNNMHTFIDKIPLISYLFLISNILGYLFALSMLFLPIVYLIIIAVEYMEFEEDWKK